MKATAKVKRVFVDGMIQHYYRYKIYYKDHRGNEKTLVRWACTASNAIMSVVRQYGWTIAEHPVLWDDEYGKALIRVWVKNQNYFYWLEAFQNDN